MIEFSPQPFHQHEAKQAPPPHTKKEEVPTCIFYLEGVLGITVLATAFFCFTYFGPIKCYGSATEPVRGEWGCSVLTNLTEKYDCLNRIANITTTLLRQCI